MHIGSNYIILQRVQGEGPDDGGAAEGDDTSTILSTSCVPGVTISSLNVIMSPGHEALWSSLYR